MQTALPQENDQRPLAGHCAHIWLNQKGKFLIEQICRLCKLYRYKSGATADWEYRAPIAFPSGWVVK